MAYPLYAPRVNNNDDIVQIVGINIAVGDRVQRGDLVVEVETDKAVSEVEAEQDGYVLKILCELEDQVAVGSVIMWLGETPDEAIPELPSSTAPESVRKTTGQPTAKARALLKKQGLKVEEVPASGERLTVADVESFLARRGGTVGRALAASQSQTPELTPEVPGGFQDLSAEQHGMLTTVAWHRDHAAATYLEIEYDPHPWEDYAAEYAREHKLMLSPLLPLLAYRLVEIVRDRPKVNATIVGERRYQYAEVNLGFTVQVGETLYLTVVRNADGLDAPGFIAALGDIQRHAMAKKLKANETQGATVAFSSMARWNVSRHVPILPPYTSLIIAHAAPRTSNMAVLGASYDHRVLSGFDVTQLLQALSMPPQTP